MTVVQFSVIACLALNHGACTVAKAAPSTQAAGDALEGSAWRAVELAGAPVETLPDGREPHLVFAAAGRLAGADGCNRLTGSYAVKGEAISFGQLASTQMACPGTEDMVRRFRGALKGTSHWRITAGRLEFYGATGKPLAVFERRTAPPAGGP